LTIKAESIDEFWPYVCSHRCTYVYLILDVRSHFVIPLTQTFMGLTDAFFI